MHTKEKAKSHWNIHPGEILREEFLRPLNLTAYQLAKEIQVPVPRVNDIVRERRAITADTAMRLARFFGNSEKFWMNLQSSYDLRAAKAKLTKQLAAIRPRAAVTEASF